MYRLIRKIISKYHNLRLNWKLTGKYVECQTLSEAYEKAVTNKNSIILIGEDKIKVYK